MIWQLTARTGPKRGESWTISDRPITVGRSLNCDISIDDPTVSRRHCQVYLEGNQVVFRDLGSRNISLVNGTAVAECRLALGDELTVGDSAFILTRTAAQRPGTALPSVDSPPSTISLGSLVQDSRDPDRAPAAVYPSTAQEVVRMFQFGRRLSRATCEEAFASVCVQELEELFPPGVTGVMWCGTDIHSGLYPASFRTPDDVLAQVRRAMESGTSSLVRHRTKGMLYQDQDLACVAPLVVSGHCRGALLVMAPARQHVLNDQDLARLDGIAQAAAPFQVWRSASGSGLETDSDDSLEQLGLVGEGGAGALGPEIQQAVTSDVNIVIIGRNHAAIALAARLIHTRSRRASCPFVTADCDAIAGPAFLGELTGVSGTPDRIGAAIEPGLLQRSDRGTLVLTNVDSLTPENQEELLALLRQADFTPAGMRNPQVYSGRIIAAAGADLDEWARNGRFNPELLALLGGRRVQIQTLDSFEEQRHEHAETRYADPRDRVASAIRRTSANRSGTGAYHDSAMDALENAERTLIRAVLAQCDGDIQRAAKVFGIPPAVLRPLLSGGQEVPTTDVPEWRP